MSTSKVIPSHKHLESKETEETSHKNTMKKETSSHKVDSKKSQTDPRGSTSRTDNLDSIILNLSQLEGNEKKEKYSNENMNNISDLVKKRPQFTYFAKANSDDSFVYNKIVKNDKTNNMSTQDHKKSSNQVTSNLDNGFILETSSKGSNKESNNDKKENSINYKQHKLSQKIEKMLTMNNNINGNTNNINTHYSKEVKFTCCFENKK